MNLRSDESSTAVCDDPFDRLPPHSIEAEQCLIASMALDKACFPEVLSVVTRDAFFQADHQIIFDVLCELTRDGSAVDPVIVKERLKRKGLLDEIGGVRYLAEVLNAVPSASHAVHYAEIVRERY